MRCRILFAVFLTVSFVLNQPVSAQALPSSVNSTYAGYVVQTYGAYIASGEAGLYDVLNGYTWTQLGILRAQLDTVSPVLMSVTNANVLRVYNDYMSVVYRRLNILRTDEVTEARLLKISMAIPSGQAVDAFPRPRMWPVYDSTTYIDKPNLYERGLKPIEMVSESKILGTSLVPDKARIQKIAMTLPTDRPVCIDIESWSRDEEHFDQTLTNYVAVARWVRAANPNVKFGFYSVLPQRRYWEPVQYRRAVAAGDAISPERMNRYIEAYKGWLNRNARMAPLAERVNYIFPSLYTFYDDRQGWQIYAKENIAAARKYGKPVIPFIWPAYHGSNEQQGGQSIGPEFWFRQMSIVRARADGVVVWHGIAVGSRWDNWKWWLDITAGIVPGIVPNP